MLDIKPLATSIKQLWHLLVVPTSEFLLFLPLLSGHTRFYTDYTRSLAFRFEKSDNRQEPEIETDNCN